MQKNSWSLSWSRSLSWSLSKRIIRGPYGHRKFSTDDPAAIIEAPKGVIKEQGETMTCHQLCLSFIPDENIFGVRADPAYALV